jgi:hypothetical protein
MSPILLWMGVILWGITGISLKMVKKVKYKRKTEFPSKLLVWLTISPKGRSRAFIAPSKQCINGEIYSNECIRKRLVPFLKKNYPDGSYVFWPDKATANYVHKAKALCEMHGIRYISRDENPPNVPQRRPVEQFWFHLKQKVYENGWETKDNE